MTDGGAAGEARPGSRLLPADQASGRRPGQAAADYLPPASMCSIQRATMNARWLLAATT